MGLLDYLKKRRGLLTRGETAPAPPEAPEAPAEPQDEATEDPAPFSVIERAKQMEELKKKKKKMMDDALDTN